jgi:hypothetical protein
VSPKNCDRQEWRSPDIEISNESKGRATRPESRKIIAENSPIFFANEWCFQEASKAPLHFGRHLKTEITAKFRSSKCAQNGWHYQF